MATPPEREPGAMPNSDPSHGGGTEQRFDPNPGWGDDANIVLRRMLPWTVSLLLHFFVVILAVFAVWAVRVELDPEQTIVPIARLSQAPIAPLELRNILKKSTRQTLSPRRVARSQNRTRSALEHTRTDSPTELIGVLGASAGDKASPFAMHRISGGALEVRIFGVGGNARRIVYVIDASGSLIDSLDFVINELKRSINDLTDQQWFSVIFFQGEGEPVEVPPPGLRKADAQRKQTVKQWIDPSAGHISAAGGTNPVKAIKLALKYRPQLMILLSDNITGRGVYEVDQQRLLRAIDRANRHHAKISTIQFLYPDPLAAGGRSGTMELIARRNGGQYRFVDARELGLE